MTILDAAHVRSLVPVRPREAHKGHFGHVLVIAGSVGYSGAAVFCAEAAARSGAGLVTLAVPEKIWSVAAPAVPEAMCHPLPCDDEGRLCLRSEERLFKLVEKADVCVCGPGLGRSPELQELLRELVRLPKRFVLDADGLNNLAEHIINMKPDEHKGASENPCPPPGGRAQCLRTSGCAAASQAGAEDFQGNHRLIITPHEGEFARIGGDLTPGRERAAMDFAATRGLTLVLKGAETLIASPEGTRRNTTGNPGLAKGGSGDVLAGLTAGLWAQGMNGFDAASLSVYLHGLAGDICAQNKGEHGMTARDLLATLPDAFKVTNN